ncbi:uncharacterized protein LOC115994155 [Quercus lobata]|uniref:uncharacterized protein LOC115994155 n=1 Tax=Quercus lobata TaxID=97700 RepID=UPI00124590C9|nr:uncharacterized protein LOC115994155 [Quercus lobata]
MASGHVIKRAKYKTSPKGAGTPGVLKMEIVIKLGNSIANELRLFNYLFSYQRYIIQCLLVFLQVFSFYVLHINLSPCHNYPYKGGVISPQTFHSLMQHLQNFRRVRMHPYHFYYNNKNGI